MSVWSDIGRILSGAAISGFSAVVESIKTVFAGDADTRRRVAFSIAIIALSAKMAKADGVVTEEEITAFLQIFEVPEGEAENVSRVFNIAKQDVAGFQSYATQVQSLFPEDEDVLRDVMDALFHIAKADSVLHENELLYLEEVAMLFGFSVSQFEAQKLRHVSLGEADPYAVLEAEPEWSFAEIKAHYRRRVAESHPDKLLMRGVPPEFIRIANDRVAALNKAWEMVEQIHPSRRTAPVGG
ncbi:MAG: DnaJ family molecular chaperone [Pseudomonadota bacterium]